MSAITTSSPPALLREEETNFGMVSLLLGIFFPVVGIFVASVVKNRAAERGIADVYARLGFEVAAFLLILAALFIAVNLVISVVLPLLGG